MRINIQGLGFVEFVKNSLAKSLIISIKPYKLIRVTVPTKLSFRQARKVIKPKITWMINNSAKMRELEKKNSSNLQSKTNFDKKVASKHLKQRLLQLASKHGFSYNKISIRDQRTRWGSCSADNNISLNINIFKLSSRLQNYILLHELLHTKIKNHSKKFWFELNNFIDNPKSLRSEIRKLSLGMFS